MKVNIHPHAAARMGERGATEQEIIETVESGEQFPAKFGLQVSGAISLFLAYGETVSLEPSKSKPSRFRKVMNGWLLPLSLNIFRGCRHAC